MDVFQLLGGFFDKGLEWEKGDANKLDIVSLFFKKTDHVNLVRSNWITKRVMYGHVRLIEDVA